MPTPKAGDGEARSASRARGTPWRGAVRNRSEQFGLKRQVVLQTAARIFGRRGFHQTTLEDIAAELHVAKPTLYHYFKSKDQILLEIQQEALSQISNFSVDPDSATKTGRDQIHAFVRRFMRMIVDDLGICLIMVGVLPLRPENQKIVRRASKDIELAMREVLRRGIEDGSIAPCDPKIATMFFFGALNWIPYWYRKGGELDPDGLAEAFLNFVMAGLAPKP